MIVSVPCLEPLPCCSRYLLVRSELLAWWAKFFVIWPLLASFIFFLYVALLGPTTSKSFRSLRCIMMSSLLALPTCCFFCLECPSALVFLRELLFILQMVGFVDSFKDSSQTGVLISFPIHCTFALSLITKYNNLFTCWHSFPDHKLLETGLRLYLPFEP